MSHMSELHARRFEPNGDEHKAFTDGRGTRWEYVGGEWEKAMPNLINTDSYADSQRYRVAKRQDGKWAVYDTERNRTVAVCKFHLDAVAAASQANEEDEEA